MKEDRPQLQAFYNSPAWKSAREAAWKKAGGLCQMCLKKGLIVPAEIVHHIVWLNGTNCRNPKISLNPDLLLPVCRRCHEEIHHEANAAAKHRKYVKRYTVDADGNVTAKPDA